MPSYEERGLPGRHRTILVVEDSKQNRAILRALFEGNYHVLEAADGQEGIELLQKHYETISLILLDVYMPVLDGFGFLRFRASDERYGNIPVIVATASNSLDDEITALKLGANDFVVKPYNPEAILNRVSNTIRLRETASIVNQLRWDVTTGLYREDFFFRRVDNLLATYPDHAYDMVCSDIRDFKTLNERYGRESCDRLLHDLADKLKVALPDVVSSGRIGGDSFGFVIEHQQSDWTAILDPLIRNMGVAHLFVRFGIVQNIEHDLSASQLCDRASFAIDELRDSEGAGVLWYDDALHQRKAMERTLVESVQEGIEQHQFKVYYQPKHDVDTGLVAGAEALVRWIHPELGFVNPAVFITLFERNGMISELDRYVCREVCREIVNLTEAGLPLVPVSINMSPLDFDDHELPQRVLDMANEFGVDPSLLHLELTETAYAEDPDVVVHALEELRSFGFKVELDDFGSGYSSLALLNLLPLDILKIDGGMVRNASRLDDFRIIRCAIQIAQLLGLETVVEGVETAEDVQRVRDMGCNLIQGFYYSRPLPQEEFEEYLRAHAKG